MSTIFFFRRGVGSLLLPLACSFLAAAQSPSASGPPVIVKGFPPSPLGQVPVSVAAITGVDVSGRQPVVTVKNTGAKAIRVFIVRLIDQNAGFTTTADGVRTGPMRGLIVPVSYDPPVAPGSTGTVGVWKGVTAEGLAQQVEICAVIFADGTHLGSAPQRYHGVDAVAGFFERWQGEADTVAFWAKKVASYPPDDHGRVAAFLARC